mmetsp:Transcript_12013/g.31669  ORF Transcript_12013/g.31669 Transcript_12013/m.31669 type:complete len:118 (+) Transcript_12013:994-1347(+)
MRSANLGPAGGGDAFLLALLGSLLSQVAPQPSSIRFKKLFESSWVQQSQLYSPTLPGDKHAASSDGTFGMVACRAGAGAGIVSVAVALGAPGVVLIRAPWRKLSAGQPEFCTQSLIS